MITVHVKLFASLRGYRPGLRMGEPFRAELEEGRTIADVLRQAGVPADEVKLVFVNGIMRERNYALSDGDELGVFPPVGGG
jgi:molybdopterin synthase sulfur carrier subunit